MRNEKKRRQGRRERVRVMKKERRWRGATDEKRMKEGEGRGGRGQIIERKKR